VLFPITLSRTQNAGKLQIGLNYCRKRERVRRDISPSYNTKPLPKRCQPANQVSTRAVCIPVVPILRGVILSAAVFQAERTISRAGKAARQRRLKEIAHRLKYGFRDDAF
jgi:hypothetical protein